MRIIVSAGPTRESIDPFRYISNPSSGKMGYALAAASRRRGHRTLLVSGPTALEKPAGVELVRVTTAAEMRKAVIRHLPSYDVLIMAAAVADYRPVRPAREKIKKKAPEMSLRLRRNPDILFETSRRKGEKILIGFSAETGNLVDNARAKMLNKNLDLVLANDISLSDSGFGSARIRLIALTADGKVEGWPMMTKKRAAGRIIVRAEKLARRRRISPQSHDQD